MAFYFSSLTFIYFNTSINCRKKSMVIIMKCIIISGRIAFLLLYFHCPFSKSFIECAKERREEKKEKGREREIFAQNSFLKALLHFLSVSQVIISSSCLNLNIHRCIQPRFIYFALLALPSSYMCSSM